MRMKEYNAYMAKRNLILKRLNDLNIEKLILCYLEKQDINIQDKNIAVFVMMIKRVIFDFNMYGMDTTINMIKDNNDYLFNYLTNRDNSSIEQLKTNVSITLRKNKINQDINDFVMEVAKLINQDLYTKQKKYAYVSG